MSEQKNKQALASQESAVDESIESRLKELHTALPGIIISFDAVKQTASVQAAISRTFNDGTTKPLPPCVDVPVHFPGGGGYVFTFPVAAGDECLLVFSERAIDGWHASGDISPPADYRLHDLSDGHALVGFRSEPKAVPNFSTDATEVRSLDNTTKLKLSLDGGVSQETAGGSTVLTAAGGFYINAPAGIFLNGQTLLIGALLTAAGNGGSGEASFVGDISAPVVNGTTDVIAAGKSGAAHYHETPSGDSTGPKP